MVYLGYLLPMIIVISVNLVVFGLVLHQIVASGSKIPTGTSVQQPTHEAHKKMEELHAHTSIFS